jgi:hypothetical protein
MKTQVIKYTGKSRSIWAKVTRKILPNKQIHLKVQCSNNVNTHEWTGYDLEQASFYWNQYNKDARTFIWIMDAP